MLRTNVPEARPVHQYVCNNPLCLKEWYGKVHFKRCIACKSPNIEKKLAESLPWTEKSKPFAPGKTDRKHRTLLGKLHYIQIRPVTLEQGKPKVRKRYDLTCRIGLYSAPREGKTARSEEETAQLERLYHDFVASGLKARSRRLIFPHMTASQRATLRLMERRCARVEMASHLGITRSALQKRLARIAQILHGVSHRTPSVDDYRVFLEILTTA